MFSAEFKEILGFRQANNALYEALRGEIRMYMGYHSINGRAQAGEADWRAMMDWVIEHRFMELARERHQNQGPDGTRKLRRAVHFLCLSCAGSARASQRLAERILDNPPPAPSTPSPPPPSSAASTPPAPIIPPRSLCIGLCDQGGVFKRYYATLTGLQCQLLPRLVVACRKYLPAGQEIREIRGGTGSPGDHIPLGGNDEIEAWLAGTKDVPLLSVLAIVRKTLPQPVVVSIQPACLTGVVTVAGAPFTATFAAPYFLQVLMTFFTTRRRCRWELRLVGT